MDGRKLLADGAAMARAIDGMADAIIAEFVNTPQPEEFTLVGLYKQGVPLARRLREGIERKCGWAPALGLLDISMYRDDVGMRTALPLIRETEMPFDMDGARVILVDDVLSSGRTIRAALDALTDYGRPALIRLAVLVDRGRPEYPIRADYAGFEFSVAADRKVLVEFSDEDAADGIYDVEWVRHFNR